MTLTDTRSVAVRALRRFPALRYRNYRRYALGQTASIGGTWLQSVALSWYVLEHNGSGRAVGLVLAAQFVPAMLLGAWAGVVAGGRRLFPVHAALASCGSGAVAGGWHLI
jgi:hypothetical protein